MATTSLKTQLESFEQGVILDSDGKTNKCNNFYDWFCSDSSLNGKAIALFEQVQEFIKHNSQINLDTVYVFFKNNCPMVGGNYDDFRICDIESGDVLYTVVPKCGHKSTPKTERAQIYSKENDFEVPIKVARTYKELFV